MTITATVLAHSRNAANGIEIVSSKPTQEKQDARPS